MIFRKLLSRVLARGRGSDQELGPHTTVETLGWFNVFGRQCSCASFMPLVAAILLLADALLATFAGLDMVNTGTRSPYVQFILSLSLATLYLILMIVALVQYMYERVLRYRFHWLWMMTLAALLAWINFGVWASWLAHFPSEADGVKGSDGTPFVAWVGANAVGLAGFFARLLVFAVGQGLRYTFERSLEIQGLLLASTTGGKNLIEAVEEGMVGRDEGYYLGGDGDFDTGVEGSEGGAGQGGTSLADYPPQRSARARVLPVYAGTNYQNSQQLRRQRRGGSHHRGGSRHAAGPRPRRVNR